MGGRVNVWYDMWRNKKCLSLIGSFALDLIFIPSLSHLGVLHHFGRR